MPGNVERCYRHCSPEHEDVGAATLEASQRAGGRFNPTSEFGALYLSCDPRTALAELRRSAAKLGIDLPSLLPRSILSVDVRLAKVLDLVDPETRAKWGLDEEALGAEEFTACQEVGRAARRAGYEAIRFPSAAGAGNNLVVFADRLHPGSAVEVAGSRRLDISDPGLEEPTLPGLAEPV